MRAEAKIIRELYERVIAGETLRGLAIELNERGEPTSSGSSRWYAITIKKVLTAPRMAGLRVHRGEVIGKGDWKPILTNAESARVRTLLLNPRRRTARPARSYFLTGLAVCGTCGGTLAGSATTRSDGVKKRQYTCRAAGGGNAQRCGTTFIGADVLEEFVQKMVLERLESLQMRQARATRGAKVSDDVKGLSEQLDEDVAQLDELAAMFGNKAITSAEWTAAAAPIRARVADNERNSRCRTAGSRHA